MPPPHEIALPAPIALTVGLDRRRNFGLDLVRAAAITAVVAAHTIAGLLPKPAEFALNWTGRAGVDLFFSLSGFLIGSMLIRMAETRLGPGPVAIFLFRRWMRTLPAYLVALGSVSWFFSAHNWHAYLLLQNFYLDEPRFLVVSWSLVLEEYFYFFVPLTMLLIAPLLGGGVRLVAAVAMLLIVLCLAGRFANAYGLQTLPIEVLMQNPFLRMDCAAYGVLAACLVRGAPDAAAALHRWRGLAWSLVALVVFALFGIFMALVTVPGPALLPWGIGLWGPVYNALTLALLESAFAVAVLLLFIAPPGMPAWLRRGIECISLSSYSIYLWHVIAIALCGIYAPGIEGWWRVLLVVVATAAMSTASFYAIERPAILLRDALIRVPAPIRVVQVDA